MKLQKIISWLDRTLDVDSFDDVSNNALQIDRSSDDVRRVAVAVDASVRAIQAAAEAGAQLLIVHHGISWGGGVKRITGGAYNLIRAAICADVAVYASHLPLDAHPVLGNNARIAALLGLQKTHPAFEYRGRPIGIVGVRRPNAVLRTSDKTIGSIARRITDRFGDAKSLVIGVCSGGAGSFAEDAKRHGCDLYVTGEADWGEVIAAENCGMPMFLAGHRETEVYGVRALAESLRKALKLDVCDLT